MPKYKYLEIVDISSEKVKQRYNVTDKDTAYISKKMLSISRNLSDKYFTRIKKYKNKQRFK